MKDRILDVYLYGRLAGKLHQGEGGRLSFFYDDNYLADKEATPLSVSMPLAREPYLDVVARPFFSGFLPDDLIRHRLAQVLGVSEENPFALLKEIGGECAGAAALFPEGEKAAESGVFEPKILSEEELAEKLDALRRRPLLAGGEGIRLSLAGAQDKLPVALLIDKNNLAEHKIALMRGGAPTTHIIKPPIERVADSVYNEFFCLKLAGRLRLPVANASIGFAKGTPYLLVERYDRAWDEEGQIRRIHQEDFCQALSIPPEQKYEREGGPGIMDCLRLLERQSARPAVDKLAFLNLLIFNYLIGNADCHGKNFSLLHGGGKPRLAPAYDLMSTAVYPEVQKKLAMKIGGEYDPEKIFRRHWHRLVVDTAGARKALDKELNDMAMAVRQAVPALIGELAEQHIASSIFDAIGQVVERRVRQVLEEF
ncbi:MAG: type II toxin-antitoxin system HipA family toxin [Alphaproteobacteria bacterium]|nr:type II toxin-antitoxin system HipA family toxin [Alphaproteobacteria bacterium]